MADIKRVTPPIGAYGRYTLKSPWTINSTISYRCISHRMTEEIVSSGRNVFETFYQPVGLTSDVAEADIALGVIFVGLLGTDGSRIYVPDTYVESYPDQTAVVYEYTVMSVDLGPQPSDIDLTAASEEIKLIVEKYTGIKSELIDIYASNAPSTTSMTAQEHIDLMDARRLAIENNVTSEVKILELTESNIKNEQLVKLLTEQLAALTKKP